MVEFRNHSLLDVAVKTTREYLELSIGALDTLCQMNISLSKSYNLKGCKVTFKCLDISNLFAYKILVSLVY